MSIEQEQHIAIIDKTASDNILCKVTGWEEIQLSSHTHNRHQIIYIVSGTLHIEVDHINYFATDNQIVWIPNGVPHRLSSNSRQVSLHLFYCYIDHLPNDVFTI